MGKRTNKKLRKCDPVPQGTVLTDSQKVQWKVGPLIGSGGFGDIYCTHNANEPVPAQTENYPFVVKIEPHENGPLFVEKNFYLKHCQPGALELYRKQRKLKHLGVAHYISSGSQEVLGVKHRYLVMPRFGESLQTLFVHHSECLPLRIVYRVALQILDVLEFLHSCGYVHGDLKPANILVGFGPTGQDRVYFIDYGMAARAVVDRELVPDLRKKHNGTLEYCSRDAHQGVPTWRGELESLAYNLIHWAGGMLPWKLLQDCTKVQQMKGASMKDVVGLVRSCFVKRVAGPPVAIGELLQLVNSLHPNEHPDYAACVGIFENGLKVLGVPNSGPIAVGNYDISGEGLNASGTPRKRRKIEDLPKASPSRRSTRLLEQSKSSSMI
ncbi:nucleosomal histone kinase 1-like [Anopheles aquasalis]|uniref:nucleosomal histone kinase 1-like n=1 Tax=Anopheles aquasalis TaxID=42839 RepID=UPI00215A9720|nr:nucleosomal histone kinase 1-like [Anopheles aquasalis]